MTSKNKYIKWIQSRIHQIELHFIKFDQAITEGNMVRAIYYQNEIYQKFWLQVVDIRDKYKPLPKELEQIYLLTQAKVYENQSISLNSPY